MYIYVFDRVTAVISWNDLINQYKDNVQRYVFYQCLRDDRQNRICLWWSLIRKDKGPSDEEIGNTARQSDYAFHNDFFVK